MQRQLSENWETGIQIFESGSGSGAEEADSQWAHLGAQASSRWLHAVGGANSGVRIPCLSAQRPGRVSIRMITSQRRYLTISYPRPTPPNAGCHDTHPRPLDPLSGAGHPNLLASVGSTEATSDQPATVSSDRSSLILGNDTNPEVRGVMVCTANSVGPARRRSRPRVRIPSETDSRHGRTTTAESGRGGGLKLAASLFPRPRKDRPRDRVRSSHSHAAFRRGRSKRSLDINHDKPSIGLPRRCHDASARNPGHPVRDRARLDRAR